jgi:hypothetical protein
LYWCRARERCRRAGARNLALGRRALERGRADVEAAAGPAQPLVDLQGASLLDDESEVMGQMLDKALSEPHVKEFDITGRPMKGWVLVEPEGVGDDEELSVWIQRAMQFVGKLPAK